MNRKLAAFIVGAGVMDDVQHIGGGEFVVTEGAPSRCLLGGEKQ